MKSNNAFIAITTEGGLLPADFLAELLAPKVAIDGLTPSAYNLAEGERINEQVNRSWNRLIGRWADFKKSIADKQLGEATTSETRDRWLHPIFQELGYGQRLPLAQPVEVEGRPYAVSHGWSHVPIHLVGSHADLDRRTPGATGAAKASPHSLVQQVLNASEGHLWGIVSNGLTFRLLRDNVALTRLSYIEWDLATIFDGELYAEFFVLWLVAHQSRFDAERPELCWLERWRKVAEDKGLRALENLYPGVKRAISALGAGLVAHRSNTALLQKLRTGELSTQDFYRQVLRIIYRLLFLLVAEDRGLLHPPGDTDESLKARRRYRDFYALARLRALTLHRAGTPHPDLWHVFRFVTEKLGSDSGCPELALPALGSFLWTAEQSTPDLLGCVVSNRDFLDAVHALAFVQDGNVRRAVDYRNLGSEELGSVYQGLLEMHPQINADAGTFVLDTAAGNERKTSGSYYTPDSLVQCLLDSALEPVIAERLAGAKTPEDKEAALLNLKVCDPAVGSGHFILRAAHRIARHLARVRSGEEEASPAAYRTALRDVIGRCLYGVDINPMSAELCRVSLWLEALEPGKPLSFLDHHIRVGNSLLGATPELIAKGIPDEAFTPIEGDDKAYCSKYKKQNKEERNQLDLDEWVPWEHLGNLPEAMVRLDSVGDDTPEQIREKQRHYEELVHSQGYIYGQFLADAWCAAFVWKKCPSENLPYPITNKILRQIERNPKSVYDFTPWWRDEVQRLAAQYQFFHWHLAYPEVFTPCDRQRGGFDCVLGNPPWERVKLQEKEWFAECSPLIANAPNAAARKRLIDELRSVQPELFQAFLDDSRVAGGGSHIVRNSGLYPLCGRGDINLYAVFAEAMRRLLDVSGRVGSVLPTGIATDDTTKYYFQEIVNQDSLVSLLSFENEEFVFPQVHHATRFCLLTVGSGARAITDKAEFVFFARQVDQVHDSNRRFTLRSQDIALLNPNTQTCPVFRSVHDARLTKAIYSRAPILISEVKENRPGLNPWCISFSSMFHMANDSARFRTRAQLVADDWMLVGNEFRKGSDRFLPLYEAKMVHHFDHRWGTYEGQTQGQSNQGKLPELDEAAHADPHRQSMPEYWAPLEEVETRLANKYERNWFPGFRGIARATDQRTIIGCVIPRSAVSGKFPLLLSAFPAEDVVLLVSAISSWVFDYTARQKVGGTDIALFIAKQLPVLPPSIGNVVAVWSCGQTVKNWILPRVLELTFTAWDLEQFGIDCAWIGPPFEWNETRRFWLRCELDAALFHLYMPVTDYGRWKPAAVSDGFVHSETQEDIEHLASSFPTPRDGLIHILDTFPIAKRKDEAAYGHYRTKDTILEIYDAMQRAMAKGTPYVSPLDPPPGPPTDAEGRFLSMYELDLDNWPSHLHPPHPDWDESILFAWFGIRQKQWIHLADEQIFPWDGRESFLYALIPYLVQERPGQTLEYLQQAALLAAYPEHCEALLHDESLRKVYRESMAGHDWLQFPESHTVRVGKVCARLQAAKILQTDPKSGATTCHENVKLPPLPPELKPMRSYVWTAADNLAGINERAADRADQTKVRDALDALRAG